MTRPVTERPQAEPVLVGQKHFLELVGMNAPLPDVLRAACRIIEDLEPGVLCSMLVPDEPGRLTELAVGPSLPESYLRGLEGLRIGPPYLGSYGETLDRGQVVVVSDVATDERFPPEWRAHLMRHGLRACRSIPVFGPDGAVLASLGAYRREPGDPNFRDDGLIQTATHIAGLAISHKQQHERLRRSEETLRQVVERCPFGIYIVDADFRIALMNAGSQAGAFINVRPVIGRPFDEAMRILWPEAVAADIIRIFRQTLATGEPYISRDFVNPRADIGETEGYEWELHRITLPDGRFGVVCYYFNATRLRHVERGLRDSEERFRSLAEMVPSIIWTAAPDGTITYANSRWLNYCGLTVEQNSRSWPELVLHPDDRQRCLEAWTTALHEGSEYQVEVRNRRHDGVYRWFVTKATPLKNEPGRVVLWFGVTTDIHDQKMMEERLRDADRRKDEFLATLAHELRNPLAPVRNSLEVMKRADGNPQLLEHARTTMERQIEQMVRLIDDLLDVSRITRDRLDLKRQPVELASVVQHAVETCLPAVEQAGHKLTVRLPREPIILDADPTRLAQVFVNLLTNSCKYSEPGGHIALTVERQAGEVILSVRDTGIGIPPDKLPEVFELFTQVDRSLERARGGLGIGLSLAKRLVELHGGRIEARSEGPGRGSEFVVRLPIRTEAPGLPPADCPVEPAPASVPLRILIVDDNRDGADSLALMLTLAGHETRTAYDGLEGLRLAEEVRPDIVLLDIGLPGLNGYDACRRIREKPWSKEVVLIALTGWGQEADRRRSHEAGFDAHLVKPVESNDLLRVLQQACGTRAKDRHAT